MNHAVRHGLDNDAVAVGDVIGDEQCATFVRQIFESVYFDAVDEPY